MQQQEMKNIIEEYIEAYNTFDIDGMLSVMHQDIEFQNISGGKINMSTKGLPELRQAAGQGKDLFESRCQKIISYRFKDNVCYAEIEYEGVLAADMPNGPKAGETLRLKGKSTFKFKDGLIISLVDKS
jgi:ketosteroid isomerase-like protein